MRLHPPFVVTVVGVVLVAATVAVESQQAVREAAEPGFNDPEFWRIVQAGPSNSDELETLVTTYVANDMSGEAVQYFADYLLRSDPDFDGLCSYCQSLIPTSHRLAQSRELSLLIAATDIVVDRVFETGSSTALIRLASITALSTVAEHRDRALYFLTAAAQLGIDDAWRDDVVHTLTHLGLYADALQLAQSIFDDARSLHYRSDDLQQWINYLTNLIDREQKIGPYIVAAASPG